MYGNDNFGKFKTGRIGNIRMKLFACIYFKEISMRKFGQTKLVLWQ